MYVCSIVFQVYMIKMYVFKKKIIFFLMENQAEELLFKMKFNFSYECYNFFRGNYTFIVITLLLYQKFKQTHHI